MFGSNHRIVDATGPYLMEPEEGGQSGIRR